MTGRTVWLASYPKSGNTWLRAVCSAWHADGEPDLENLIGDPVTAERASFDYQLGVNASDLTHDEIEVLRPRVDELLDGGAHDPLLRKTHDALFTGPTGEHVISRAATRAAVYMLRDPRDVAVSLAHHGGMSLSVAATRMNAPGNAIAARLGGLREQFRQRLGTWSEHVRSWVDEAPFPVHVLRYEDCLDDPLAAFGAALRFTGLDVADDERLARAVEHASFTRLQSTEIEHGFSERPPSSSRFFRQGRAGLWREELPAALAASIETAHAHVMRRFGYL